MNHDDYFDDENELPVIVLLDEEGEEHQFELIAEIEILDNKYRVLIPFAEEDEDEEEELEIFFFKVLIDDEGNEFLTDIEDDEEWEMVADAWQEIEESEDF